MNDCQIVLILRCINNPLYHCHSEPLCGEESLILEKNPLLGESLTVLNFEGSYPYMDR
jgi:hypothetical protein